jgi:tRNA uridine 5-carboxymethylaminomethyl modification enzyme
VNQDGARRSAFQILSFPDVGFADLLRLDPSYAEIDPESQEQLARDALYASYIDRQARDVAMMKRDEAHAIPEDFAYQPIDGLSNELKGKLERVRPENLAQAARIEGMTPAALSLILAKLRQAAREKIA